MIFYEAESLPVPPTDWSWKVDPKTNDFINHLPIRLQADYEKNQQGFSGNTYEMNEAGSNMVANLREIWLELIKTGFRADAFPKGAEKWLSDYTARLVELYSLLNEPDGPGTGGTIVGQLGAGDLIDNYSRLIERTVEALISTEEDQTAFNNWKARWEQAQPH